jgi:hypothetical protein
VGWTLPFAATCLTGGSGTSLFTLIYRVNLDLARIAPQPAASAIANKPGF